jgi:predicted metal-dependent peptidase
MSEMEKTELEENEEKVRLQKELLAARRVMSREGLERLEIGISRLTLSFPLFYIPLINLRKVESWNIPTMGVGPVNKIELGLYYNPEFTLSLNPIELRAVLQHEAMHILLQHLTRGRDFGSNFKMYNIAADLTINPKLEGIPSWAYFPEKEGLPSNESAELYYKLLKERREEMTKRMKKQMEGMTDEQIADAFFKSLEGEALDDHSMWEDMTQTQKDIIKEKIRNLSEEAMRAQDAVGWGKVPGNLHEEIMAANKPLVNWKRELKFFIGQVVSCGRKSTRLRPNRRYKYLQPGTKRSYTSKLLIALDCSGSVSDKELQMFIDEVTGMVGKVQVDVIPFDAVCHGEPQKFTRKNASIKVHGRGGTDFGPPIRMADDLKYDGLIVMTDGECSFPVAPRCRMMWVLSRNSSWADPPPYGRVIQLNELG